MMEAAGPVSWQVFQEGRQLTDILRAAHCSLMAEHCWTRGDVGHPTSRLRQRFRKVHLRGLHPLAATSGGPGPLCQDAC